MAYIREFIATCEAYGWNGGPQFNTLVVVMANGRERRRAQWAELQNKYTLPFQNVDPDGYRDIRRMFLVCRGQLNCFLYSDPLDREADDELLGFGTGSEDTFQLSKLSVLDGVPYQRNVYAIPDDVTLTVTIDDVPTTAFTVDRDRGLLIFDAPPGNGLAIRWSGPFAVWVRFNHDWLPFSIDTRVSGEMAHNGTIDLLEMPPPELEASS